MSALSAQQNWKHAPVGVMKRCSFSRASSTGSPPTGASNLSVHCKHKKPGKRELLASSWGLKHRDTLAHEDGNLTLQRRIQ